jgi:hypothetical protein
MEQETSGAELLLSEPEFVAWLGLGQGDDHRAPLWRVTVGMLPDAPRREAAQPAFLPAAA